MTKAESEAEKAVSSEEMDLALKVALLGVLGKKDAARDSWFGIPRSLLLSGMGAVFLALLNWFLSIETEKQKLSNDLIKKALEATDQEQAGNNLRFLSKLHLIPFTEAEIEKVLSDPQSRPVTVSRSDSMSYVVDEQGQVTFQNNWEAENIVTVRVPQLIGLNTTSAEKFTGDVRFNKDGVEVLKAAFVDVEREGKLGLIKSFDGAYVPRTRRGANRLSAHATGKAFDLNCRWNLFGREPAPKGQEGSLVELAPIFERHGFVWGGNSKSQMKDTCHFQLKEPQ